MQHLRAGAVTLPSDVAVCVGFDPENRARLCELHADSPLKELYRRRGPGSVRPSPTSPNSVMSPDKYESFVLETGCHVTYRAVGGVAGQPEFGLPSDAGSDPVMTPHGRSAAWNSLRSDARSSAGPRTNCGRSG